MNLINKNNFTHIKEKIVQAAKKSGRRPKDIQLVAITKRFPVCAIQQAYNNDIFCVGDIQTPIKNYQKLASVRKFFL